MKSSLVRAGLLLGILESLAAPAHAQGQTYVVDAAGGPGFNFLDIPPALAVAQDGDTILVRTGVYTGGTITKGITMRAAPGASPTVGSGSSGHSLEIMGLSANQTVVIDGIQMGLTQSFPFLGGLILHIQGCAGHVHLARINLSLFTGYSSFGGLSGIGIVDCAYVSLHASSITDGFPLSCSGSTLLISSSNLNGKNAFYGMGAFGYSSPGMVLTDSDVTLSRTTVTGGSGASSPGLPLDPSPAISQTGGQTTISGTSAYKITGGSPAIQGAGGVIQVDPRVVFGGAAPGHQVTIQRIPSLAANDSVPGGTLWIDLLATGGDLSEIYLSLPYGPIASPIPNSGKIWVDFGRMINLGRFTVPPSEQFAINVGYPPNPVLVGLPITVQALTASFANGLRFSTPATIVLH